MKPYLTSTAGILSQSSIRGEMAKLVDELFTYPLDIDDRRTAEAIEQRLDDEGREVTYTQLTVIRELRDRVVALASLPATPKPTPVTGRQVTPLSEPRGDWAA